MKTQESFFVTSRTLTYDDLELGLIPLIKQVSMEKKAQLIIRCK